MLTDLQVEIAKIVSHATDHLGFALAGGGAVIALGVVDRRTRDLDFFTSSVDAVRPGAAAVETALQRAGLRVSRSIDTESFVRMTVVRDEEACIVDLGHDARRWPAHRHELGTTVSLEELAADKTLALLARSKLSGLARDEFPVDDARFEQMDAWALRWRVVLLEQAREIERRRGVDRGPDVGPEIGL